ncbi:MAG TPA: hypothetical protein VK791_02205 [bacterium]|nr:hypothetical protein [bacterium]
MKKAETFVKDVATVFVALSVVVGAAYSLGLILEWNSKFGDIFSDPKHADNTDPLSLFLCSHLHLTLASGIIFEIIAFIAAVGLLDHKGWARKTFLGLFGFLALKHLLFFCSGFYQLFYPRVEMFNKILYHSLILYWGCFAFGALWNLTTAGLYSWLFYKFNSKAVRKVFK